MQREMGIGVDGKWVPESHRTALEQPVNAVTRADVTIDLTNMAP